MTVLATVPVARREPDPGEVWCPAASAHRSLVRRVLRFIDENLADPDLSSRTIARAHFVSVRQLQKVFEAEGEPVTTVVRNRRLERCRRDLADPFLREQAIASIGARWGFLDAAHFSRLFRAAFGASPREYRRTTHQGRRNPTHPTSRRP